MYLTQCTLHGPQAVGLLGAVVAAANVVEFIAESLHFLEVVVKGKDFGEGGVDGASDHLCPIHL